MNNTDSQLFDNLTRIIQKPRQESQPSNIGLYLAYLSFNGIFCLLDAITAVTVATLTSWLYGLLTFAAGFGPLIIHEILFTRAYANVKQKILAISGAGLGIISTLGIGILSGLINVLNFSENIPPFSIELTAIIALVLIAGLHGLLFAVYFYIDAGHIARMKRTQQLAQHLKQQQDLEDAKIIIRQAKEINAEIQSIVKAGDGAALNAALQSMELPALADQLFRSTPE